MRIGIQLFVRLSFREMALGASVFMAINSMMRVLTWSMTPLAFCQWCDLCWVLGWCIISTQIVVLTMFLNLSSRASPLAGKQRQKHERVSIFSHLYQVRLARWKARRLRESSWRKFPVDGNALCQHTFNITCRCRYCMPCVNRNVYIYIYIVCACMCYTGKSFGKSRTS